MGNLSDILVNPTTTSCPNCFGGCYTLGQLRSPSAPPGAGELLEQLDLLVDGPYVESQAIHSPNSPVSSRNQRVHVFNPALADQIHWASDQIEIHVLKDGTRIVTGYQGQMSLSD